METIKLLITISIVALIMSFIIIHFISVIKLKGYTNYLNNLNILKQFKEVDYKIGYSVDLNFLFNNSQIHSTVQSDCVSCLHHIDSRKFSLCEYTNELYYTQLRISTHEQKNSKWYRKDFMIDRSVDFIYSYYYFKLIRKIKKAKLIKVVDEIEYSDKINEHIIKKQRTNKLELLLDS